MKTYPSMKADPQGGVFGKIIWLMALVAMFLVSPLASATVWDLTAGRTNVVGALTVTNDTTNVYVTYELTDLTAKFGTLHLWVGTNLSTLPVNKAGILVPGQFPHTADVTGATKHTFIVPWTAFNVECGTKLFVVAHAEVNYFDETGVETGGDTAFGGDTSGAGKRWWFYGQHTLTCPQPPPSILDGAHSEWCSPGYWKKNIDNTEIWNEISYSVDAKYSDIADKPVILSQKGINDGANDDPSLREILNNNNYYSGEDFNNVADLLSYAHPGINFTGDRYFDVNNNGIIDKGTEHDCPLDSAL